MNDREVTNKALSLWPSSTPRAGFADAVLSATAGPRRSPRRWPWLAAAATALVVAVLLLVRGGAPPTLTSGARVTTARETLPLGVRAVAVAEADAVLAWQVRGDSVDVDQRLGSVFYRVEPDGAPFVVKTPAGRVRVQGSCFRVEVRAVNKDRIIAAGVGAAIATAVTVLVYEGRVTAHNDVGRADATAGQELEMTAGKAPVARPHEQAAVGKAPPGATREELLAREDSHLRQIDELTRKVKSLEAKVEAMPRLTEAGEPPRGKMFDFSPEELQWMAKKCQIRYDVPGYTMALGAQLDADDARDLHLTDNQLAAVNQVLAAGDNSIIEKMRDLYVELTGDRRLAEALSPHNLQHEIFEKSPPEELHQAFQRLAAERAGLARPPADEAGMSPVERLLRLLERAGDDYQRRLADVLGPDQAASLRRRSVGMGRRVQSGCPDP